MHNALAFYAFAKLAIEETHQFLPMDGAQPTFGIIVEVVVAMWYDRSPAFNEFQRNSLRQSTRLCRLNQGELVCAVLPLFSDRSLRTIDNHPDS
jgi:hypothetical protein